MTKSDHVVRFKANDATDATDSNDVSQATTAPGRVVFVGAGPGAADLLTRRAVRELEQADVVLYDALGTEEALAFCPQARRVAVGKRAGGVSTEQVFINRRLVAESLAGHRVVRLKGGDPVVFGRLDEEIQALHEAAIDFDIVPGITAASASAAAAGVPLTQRGLARSVTLTTPSVERGASRNDDWLANCDPHGTSAVYMAGRDIASTAQALLARGYSATTPTLIVRAVSTPNQHIESLSLGLMAAGAFANRSGSGPCLLLIGDAVSQRAGRTSQGVPATDHAMDTAMALNTVNRG